jgi:hypothetical protein
MKTKKEARLLTKADSACRKMEFLMNNCCKFGGETKPERIVVICAAQHHSKVVACKCYKPNTQQDRKN